MSRTGDRALHGDLARWQAGELSAAELRQRHPAADVDVALAAHARLLALADTPVPDAGAAWSRVAASLPTRGAPSRPRRLRRPVVAAIVAAVLAGPAVSYAAAPDAVRSGIRQVVDLFTDRRDDAPRARPVDPDEESDADVEPDGTTVEPHTDVPATPQPADDGGSAREPATTDDPDVEATAGDSDEPAGDDGAPVGDDGSSPDTDDDAPDAEPAEESVDSPTVTVDVDSASAAEPVGD